MKILNFIIILYVSIPNLHDVVNEFHELNTKELELIFIDNYKENKNPSIVGYVHAVEMKQAEYKINPIVKLNIFNKTKKKLNQLIANYPDDIHLRYIRLMLQEKSPAFLGYNNFIKEDKLFITKKLEIKDNSDYLDKFIYKNTSL